MIVIGNATVGDPRLFRKGSPLQYNKIELPFAIALSLTSAIVSLFIMFPDSVTSDLIKSLVDWLNNNSLLTNTSIDWYYATIAPEAIQPGKPIGLVEIRELLPRALGDGTIMTKYRFALLLYYHYDNNPQYDTGAYETLKSFSWLNEKVAAMIQHGYSATFSNGETFYTLFSGSKVLSSRLVEPRLQDSLIQSACEIVLTWEQQWSPQPPYLI